jgi:hypothetical protein
VIPVNVRVRFQKLDMSTAMLAERSHGAVCIAYGGGSPGTTT